MEHASAAIGNDIITGTLRFPMHLECPVNRRSLLKSALLALSARVLPLPRWIGAARAQDAAAQKNWRHGLSLFGDLKYPPGFARFDYVNANAPKAGVARQISIGTFDN